MKYLLLLVLNSLTLAGTLLLNYLAGTGKINGQSIGAVSAQFPTLLTPAGYAFSIWSLIYLLLLSFVIYQWIAFFKNRNEDSLKKAGLWFSLANVANGLWVIAFVHEHLGLSVFLILLLLFSLLMLVLRLKLEVWDAPLRIILFVWWPICIYTGWVVLATITNVAVYLKSLGWQGGTLAAEFWAIGLVAVAALLYLFLIYARNMREAALVGVWGLIAIAYKQWEVQKDVAIAALLAALLLFLAASYHGLKNKATSPFIKWKTKEW